jgi:hypothetical protein
MAGIQAAYYSPVRKSLHETDWRSYRLVIGSLPFFVGLAVVLPVLAHSTWHLYRKVVEPNLSPRPDRHRQAKGRRYAADFPAVLLPWTHHEDEP